ncbi:MAG TPA: response regulator transcription factor, partial [Euzebyales bacterium]|nr:response regulator transcription factor [Euzebyales bacterium]
MIRVLIADDNPVVRSGLMCLLEADPRIEVVAEAADGREAVRLAGLHDPDVALLDVRMPAMDGVAAAEPISDRAPVLMLTYTDEPKIVKDAIRAGASGYLVHGRFTADQLVAAVVDVAGGRPALSPTVTAVLLDAVRAEPASADRTVVEELTAREREIMDLLAQGLTGEQVAERLVLSSETVKTHIRNAMTKLEA